MNSVLQEKINQLKQELIDDQAWVIEQEHYLENMHKLIEEKKIKVKKTQEAIDILSKVL